MRFTRRDFGKLALTGLPATAALARIRATSLVAAERPTSVVNGVQLGVITYTPKVIQMWDTLEDQGHRISAVSGSDDHSAGIDEGSVGAPVRT